MFQWNECREKDTGDDLMRWFLQNISYSMFAGIIHIIHKYMYIHSQSFINFEQF